MHPHSSIQRCSKAFISSSCNVLVPIRPRTALNATAAPSRAAAEETARKAAAVREQLRHHSSKHARQIHEQNVHIAELQQAAARRAAQQAAQHKQGAGLLEQQQQWLEQLQQTETPQHAQQQQQQSQRFERLPWTMRNRQQQQGPGTPAAMHPLGDQQQYHQQQLQQHRMQLQQQYHQQQQPQDDFQRLLQEVEVLARSDDLRRWQTAAFQCRQILVPAVTGPQQAAAAWRLMVNLAGRQLNRHAQGALGGAAAMLVQVSLANKDVTMLQRLLSSNRRFIIGPRQLRDLTTVAAAAGADTDMLTALLELAPACQLSSRAYFVVVLTCINRKHYQEAQQCLARLHNVGVRLSPALVRLQQRAHAALKGVASR